MTERLITIANIYTVYELTLVVLSIFIASLILAFVSHRKTDDLKLSLLYISQPIIFILFFSAASIVASYYFETITNGYQQVGLFIGLIFVYLNLVLYSIFYHREKDQKVFDPDHVNRNHFASTLNSIVLLIILGVSFGFFSPSQLGQVFLITSLSAVLTLFLTHGFILRLFQDRSNISENE